MRVVAYEDVRMRDVLADLNRYFERKVVVGSDSLGEKRITIRLQIEDREKAVSTLARLLSLRVLQTEEGTALLE